MSRRPASTAPKPPTSLSPSTVIADAAVLIGTHRITLGPNTIIHPRAKLNSTHGPITLGEGCIVCERAAVGLSTAGKDDSDGVVLGKNVVIEATAVVEAAEIGEGSIIEVGAQVGRGAMIGKVCSSFSSRRSCLDFKHQGTQAHDEQHCKITPLSIIAPGETLHDFTVVYGINERRTEQPGLEGLRAKAHEKQIELLKRLIHSNLAKWQS